MTKSWLYLSLHGRLSAKSFREGFKPLAFIGVTVLAFTPTRITIGYPLDHWAGLAYSLAAVWPWFALTAKRLHDNGRSLALALPAIAGLPAAEAARLAHDYYGVPTVIPVTIGGFASGLTLCAWCLLMWRIYRLPGSPGENQFGPPPSG